MAKRRYRVPADEIIAALIKTGGSCTEAAELVGISSTQIYRRAARDPAIAEKVVKQNPADFLVPENAGRPALCTKQEVIEAIIAARGNISQAARDLGYTQRNCLHIRIRRDPELRAAVDEARERVIDVAENVVHEAVASGDVKAAQFVLSRLGKDRGWTERREVANAHLHVHAAAELPQAALERALAERLGVETLPTNSDELSGLLEAEFSVEEETVGA